MIPHPSRPQSRQKNAELRIESISEIRQSASGHEMFWFHCGRCGSLFQAVAGHSKDRLCTNCGFDPSAAKLLTPNPVAKVKTKKGSSTSKRRKPKKKHLMFKLLSGWLLLIAMIIFGVHHRWHKKTPENQISAPPATSISMTQDLDLLQKALPQCFATLSGFLASNIPEGRNQFVISPISNAFRINRFYALNPAIKINPRTLGLIDKSVLQLPGFKAIESHWKSKDGKDIDAVFRQEDGEWRLDWEHFIRYSDYPWLLFLAGSGPPEGEFRLLARERLAEERKNAESISVVLYEPRFSNPQNVGTPSPEFLISRNTRDAQLLDAAFRLARSGKRIFDSKLPDLNPGEMIPVRIKVRRIEEGTTWRFEITSVTACHWYSLDDPGVEPLAPEAATPEGTK